MTKIDFADVLRLRKSLHGLKQSSHEWSGTYNHFVMSIGFGASVVDGGLFLLEDQGTVVAAVILYVDDLLIIANNGMFGRSRIRLRSGSGCRIPAVPPSVSV